MAPPRDPLPLAGVTVLELGMVLAGPFAGSLFVDLGATVIKIEPPGAGDPMRLMGPRKNGVALWWGVGTRGKKCITLNLKDEAARGVFRRLIARADVLVENYRPDVLDRLGLGWEALHAINPRLTMLSITGFGQTGPAASRPGFGKIAEGMSGLVSLTGDPDANPVFVGYSLADTTTALFGVFATNLALYLRDVQGTSGAHIDLSLYEPLFRMMEAQLAMHRATGKPQLRTGSNDPYGWGRSEARDPLFTFVKSVDGTWIEVMIPHVAMAALEKLSSITANGEAKQLFASLGAWASTKTSDSIRQALQDAGAQVAPVLDGLTITELDYFVARGDVLPTTDVEAGSFHVTGFFPKHYPRPDVKRFDGPAIGAHNYEVLVQQLGLADDEFAELLRRGAI